MRPEHHRTSHCPGSDRAPVAYVVYVAYQGPYGPEEDEPPPPY